MKKLTLLTIIALQADPAAVTQLQEHHTHAKAAVRATFSHIPIKTSSPKPAVLFDGLNSAVLTLHVDDFLHIGDALTHLPALNSSSPVVNTALSCGALLIGIGLRWMSKRGLASAQADYDKAVQASLVAETGIAEKNLHAELAANFINLMDVEQQTNLGRVQRLHDLTLQIAALQKELGSAHEQATQPATDPETIGHQQALLKTDLTKHENLLNGIEKFLQVK